MRIALLRPFSTWAQHCPPVGIVSLANYLEREFPGLDIHLFDEIIRLPGDEPLVTSLQRLRPDVIGLSVLHKDAPEAFALVKALRPFCRVMVLGGAFASAEPARILQAQPRIDACVVGEGEAALADILRAVDAGREDRLWEIPGVVARRDGVPVPAARRPALDIDTLPSLDYGLLPMERYLRWAGGNVEGGVQMRTRALPIVTSRGCPYQCTFCFRPFGNTYRARSADRVLQDITSLSDRYDVQEFHILDDTFALDRARVLDISRGIVATGRNYLFSLSNGANVSHLTDEVVDALKAMGTYRVSMGVESAVPRVLKKIRKNIDPEEVSRAASRLASRRILAGGFFMLGLPDETEDDFRKTVEFASRSPLHTAGFSICQLFPGTEASNEFLRTRPGRQDEECPIGCGYESSAMNPSRIPTDRLPVLRSWAYRKFYLNASRVFHIWRDVPNTLALLRPGIQAANYLLGRRGLLNAG